MRGLLAATVEFNGIGFRHSSVFRSTAADVNPWGRKNVFEEVKDEVERRASFESKTGFLQLFVADSGPLQHEEEIEQLSWSANLELSIARSC